MEVTLADSLAPYATQSIHLVYGPLFSSKLIGLLAQGHWDHSNMGLIYTPMAVVIDNDLPREPLISLYVPH